MKYQNALEFFNQKFNYNDIVSCKEFTTQNQILSSIDIDDCPLNVFFRACRVASYVFSNKDASDFLDAFDNLNELPVEPEFYDIYEKIIINYIWIDYIGNYVNFDIVFNKMYNCDKSKAIKTFKYVADMSANRSESNSLLDWVLNNHKKFGLNHEDVVSNIGKNFTILNDSSYEMVKSKVSALDPLIVFNGMIRKDEHIINEIRNLSAREVTDLSRRYKNNNKESLLQYIEMESNLINKLIKSGDYWAVEDYIMEIDSISHGLYMIKVHKDKLKIDTVLSHIRIAIDDISHDEKGIVEGSDYSILRGACSELVPYLIDILNGYLSKDIDSSIKISDDTVKNAVVAYSKLRYLAECNRFIYKGHFTVDLLSNSELLYFMASRQIIDHDFFPDKKRLSESLLLTIESKIHDSINGEISTAIIDNLLKSLKPFKVSFAFNREIDEIEKLLAKLSGKIFNAGTTRKNKDIRDYMINAMNLRMSKQK